MIGLVFISETTVHTAFAKVHHQKDFCEQQYGTRHVKLPLEYMYFWPDMQYAGR